MNYSKIGYKIACWSFIIVGIGHIITDLLAPKTPDQIEFLQKMKDFSLLLMGTETNIFSLHQGFSIVMGFLLFSYGSLNLMILKNSGQNPIAANIILLNTLVSLFCTVFSFFYFFIVPIALTGLAFLAFTFSFLKRTEK